MFGLCVFFLGCVSYLDKFPYSQVIRKTLKWSASLVIWQGKASPCAGRWRITLTVVAVIKSTAETSTDSDVRKSETLPTAGRNINWSSHYGKCVQVPQKTKNSCYMRQHSHSWAYICRMQESACQCGRRKRLGFDPWVGKFPWSRKSQPAPVFLPGKFHGQRSLAGYSPWGLKELDVIEHILTPAFSPLTLEI